MMRWLVFGLGVALVAVAAVLLLQAPSSGDRLCTTDETLSAPSGRSLTLCDVLYEEQPDESIWAVIRVVDNALPAAGEDMVTDDHDWACETWGIAALDKEPRPTRIVVQIMERAFVRGEPAPGLRQRIEAYSEDNGTCLWELF